VAAINIAFYEAIRWTQCYVSRRPAPNGLRSWVKVQRKAEEANVSVGLGEQNRAAVIRAHVHAQFWLLHPTPQPSPEQ